MNLRDGQYNDVKSIARNQYEATLQMLSKHELLVIAATEHGLSIVPDAPKTTIIEKILNAKYG